MWENRTSRKARPEQRRRDAKAPRTKMPSTKSEARSSKQIQMTKKHNVPNNRD
jgi:hypothetical protein